ncbi:DUF1883 domain-containing protein [Spirosoma areae]
MKFTHHDLGNVSQGQTVVVTLSGNAANVQLLDDLNFRHYRAGQRYSYRGGHVTRSPFRLSIPSTGHWYVVVDLGGRAGSVGSSVRVA